MPPIYPLHKWMNCVMLVLASLAIRKDALLHSHSCVQVTVSFWLCKWNRFSEWIKNWPPLTGKNSLHLRLTPWSHRWISYSGQDYLQPHLTLPILNRHLTKYPRCLYQPKRYIWTPLHLLSRPVSSARHCLALWATSLLFNHSLK